MSQGRNGNPWPVDEQAGVEGADHALRPTMITVSLAHTQVGSAVQAATALRDAGWLACLTGAALLIRLIGISVDPLWFDEAATLEIAALPFREIFGAVAPMESSPPGFYALARVWVWLVGDGTTAIRLLPALAGALTVIPVWLFARAAFGSRAAWLAAAMFAVTASQVRMSQDARTYTVLGLVFACAMAVALYLALRPRLDRGTAWLIAALGLLEGLLLWLHGTAAVQIALIGMFVIATGSLGSAGWWRSVISAGSAGAISVVVGALPLLYAFSHVAGEAFSDRWIEEPDLVDSLQVYGRTLIAPSLYGLSPIAGIIQGGLVAVAAFVGLRNRHAPTLGLATALGATVLALPLLSNFVPIMLDRTILFMLIPVQALVAAGAAALPRPVFLTMATAMLTLNVIGVTRYNATEVRKEQWPSVAAWLAPRIAPDEPILVTEGIFAARALAEPFLSEPLRSTGRIPRIVVLPPRGDLEQYVAARRAREVVADPRRLCATIADARVVWLVSRGLPATVVTDPGYTARPAAILALRTAEGTLAEEHIVDNFLIQRWAMPGCPSTR